MFCNYCGSPVSDDSAFCAVCGRQLNIPVKNLDVASDSVPATNGATQKNNPRENDITLLNGLINYFSAKREAYEAYENACNGTEILVETDVDKAVVRAVGNLKGVAAEGYYKTSAALY